MKKSRRSGGGGGFTLIELLLAVAILAVVLSAITSVFYGAMRLQKKTTDSVEGALPVQQAFAIIRRDLQGILPPSGPLSGYLKTGVTSMPSGAQQQQSSPEIFTSTGWVDDTQPWGDAQKVVYFLRPQADRSRGSGKDLIRAVTRNLLATVTEEPVEQLLMSDVEQLQFSFYDGSAWQESWDSTAQTNTLPKALRMQLTLATDAPDRMGRKTPVQLVVPVLAQGPTNQPAATGGTQ